MFINSITPLQNLKLPNPSFCSIVRFITKPGFLNIMVEELIKAPSDEAVSQHTIVTGDNEIMNRIMELNKKRFIPKRRKFTKAEQTEFDLLFFGLKLT